MIKINRFLLYFTCLLSSFLSAQDGVFVPNKGQWNDKINFKLSLSGTDVFLEDRSITLFSYDPSFFAKMHDAVNRDSVCAVHALNIAFDGANEKTEKILQRRTSAYYNYYLDSSENKWATGLRGGYQVKYVELYDRINFIVKVEGDHLKYEFEVLPGGKPEQIKMTVNGADRMEKREGKILIHTSLGPIVDEAPVSIQNQKRIETSYVLRDSTYQFSLNAPYDSDDTLLIDPVLVFGTYSGSTANNFGFTATFDEKGFLYSGSSVFDLGYPTTTGAYSIVFSSNPSGGTAVVYDAAFGTFIFAGYGNTDVGISKFDTTGTRLIYSTYLGGRLCEVPHSVVVNDQDELVVLGTTSSDNFPTSSTGYDRSFAGGPTVNLSRGIGINYVEGADLFLTKFSADGSRLIGSTLFGGTATDGLNVFLNYNYADQMRGDVQLDQQGNIYIATCTFSTDIPNVNGFQGVNRGDEEGLVASFNQDLSGLNWASYIGGSGRDALYSLIFDSRDNLFVAGGTTSSDLSTSIGAVQPTFQGGPSDGFLAKLDKNGTGVQSLTYLGSAAYDQTYFIRVDNDDEVYILGQSNSLDSSLIHNAAYYSVKSGVWLSKLNNDLDNWVWSTTVGSGDSLINLSPTAFSVDICSNMYFSGWGSSSQGFELIPNYLYDASGLVGHNGGRGTQNMPLTLDAFQTTTDGHDFYLMVIDKEAQGLVYGSYYGGGISHEHVDGGTSRFDRKGKMYQSVCAGCGGNDDFPTKPNPGAHSNVNNASCNNGVFKFDFLIPTIVADFLIPEYGCVDTAYTFINTSRTMDSTTFEWYFGDGYTSTLEHPSHQYSAAGTYDIKLIIRDPTSCNLIDSITKSISFRTDSSFTLGVDTICQFDSLQLVLSKVFPDSSSFNWNPGLIFSDSTLYQPKAFVDRSQDLELLIYSAPGCMDTVIYPVFVPDNAPDLDQVNACLGDSALLFVASDAEYDSIFWAVDTTFSPILNDSHRDTSFSFFPSSLVDTSFYLKIRDQYGCYYLDTLFVGVKSLELALQSDTIVCSTLPIERSIISPNALLLDSISWGPIAQIGYGADSTTASLNIFGYLSDFIVFARDTFGCKDLDTVRIVDNSLNLDLPDTTICFGDTVEIGYQLSYNPLYTYRWFPDSLVTQKDSLVTKAFPGDSSQLVLVVSNSFCDDSVGLNLAVNKVEIGGKIDTLLCNDLDLFKAEITGEDTLRYLWSSSSVFSDTLLIGTNEKIYNVPTGLGSYQYFVEASDIFGCKDTLSVVVRRVSYDLDYPPVVELCANDTVELAPNGDSSSYAQSSFSWSPTPLVFTDTTKSKVSVFGVKGSYDVIVRSTDANGCKDIDTLKVAFAELDTSKIAAALAPDQIVPGEEVIITVEPSGFVYLLTPDDLVSTQEGELTVKPQESTTYLVEVSDQNVVSCRASRRVSVEVLDFICEDPYIYLPNAFSPNGDGENDILFIRGKNLTKVYLAIYNRWGQLVFETENQHIGWDGTFEGMEIDPAVYDYYMRWECEPGQEYFKKGNITLIR